MFRVNDRVVYPGHGVAKINRVVEKRVGGNTAQFFELKFLNKDVTILVPMNNLDSVGIRKLSTQDNIDTIFKIISKPASCSVAELTASNWNKRSKDYQLRLRSGDLGEISKIYRDLNYIAQQKELSFGEKSLLQETEMLLAEEISIVRKIKEDKAIEHLRLLFQNGNRVSSIVQSV